MSPLDKLEKLFTDFPGIGPRQAKRFAYSLLKKDERYITTFIDTVKEVRSHTKLCQDSYQYFYTTDSNETLAPIARNVARDDTILLIVEKDVDVERIERAGVFNGRYFVLGGTLPILAEHPENMIRINELRELVERKAINNGLREIVLGTSFHPEGENTARYVHDQLKSLIDTHNLNTTTLARGLSTGTEIEYSDEDTIKSAFNNRL